DRSARARATSGRARRARAATADARTWRRAVRARERGGGGCDGSHPAHSIEARLRRVALLHREDVRGLSATEGIDLVHGLVADQPEFEPLQHLADVGAR